MYASYSTNSIPNTGTWNFLIALPVLHIVKVWLNGWLVTSGFVQVVTIHKNGTVRKLSIVYQQVSTTRALP